MCHSDDETTEEKFCNANPFSGFEEEGDDQFLKEMEKLIEKEAQIDEVDEENIKQWLENDVEIPGHKIHGEAEGEEDEIVSQSEETETLLIYSSL